MGWSQGTTLSSRRIQTKSCAVHDRHCVSDQLKQPLLLGPGSILVAHTRDEFVLKKDLEEAVGLYSLLVRRLLANDAQA
jgi:acetylornithine deacetylase/succinyl-diaminopimelate desuccinylase-like protein